MKNTLSHLAASILEASLVLLYIHPGSGTFSELTRRETSTAGLRIVPPTTVPGSGVEAANPEHLRGINGRQALEGNGKRERPTEKAGGGLKFG